MRQSFIISFLCNSFLPTLIQPSASVAHFHCGISLPMPFLLNGTAATMQTERTKRLREGHIPSSTPVSECRRVESVEDLETYELNEECVFVAIRPEDNAVFAERGFFRSLAKNYKKILSDASLDDCHISGWDTLDSKLQELIQSTAVTFRTIVHTRKYKDLSLDECLRLLGDSHGVMVSFETVGHIAHLNLPTERLWAKDIIAKILLDKHKHIRTVVNKVKEVDNVFRTMDLELLGGDDDLVAVQHENRYTFKIDFRNVYWNSRLIQERERVSDTFYMGDVIVDMFAGVGPFAVYGAGKGCLVLANDLNPVGTQYIQINAALNKLTDLIHHYNMDAREFARTVADHKILDKRTTAFKEYTIKPESKIHFLMNLPKIAIEFLDVFRGLAGSIPPDRIRTCVVHCYSFSDAEDVEGDITQRIENVLEYRIENKKIIKVRDVSPKKHMYCIEFNMPSKLLCGN